MNTDPPKLRTRIRALGDSTLDRGGLEEGQQALLFVRIDARPSSVNNPRRRTRRRTRVRILRTMDSTSEPWSSGAALKTGSEKGLSAVYTPSSRSAWK